MNNIIALLNCSFLVSSCPCYLVVARLETSSSGVTLHCDNLPRDVSLDTLYTLRRENIKCTKIPSNILNSLKFIFVDGCIASVAFDI